jgi:hypothetical protein
MPSSDRQPLAEPELVWLVHSAMVWALTGVLMMMARRPLWAAVGVVLTVLGLGVVGWMVRRRLRQQPPRQQTNGIAPDRSIRPGHRAPRAVKEGAMSVFQPTLSPGSPPRASSVSIPPLRSPPS